MLRSRIHSATRLSVLCVAACLWSNPARADHVEITRAGEISPARHSISLDVESYKVGERPVVGVVGMSGQLALSSWLALSARLPVSLGLGGIGSTIIIENAQMGAWATRTNGNTQMSAGLTVFAPTGDTDGLHYEASYWGTRAILYHSRSYDDPVRNMSGAYGARADGRWTVRRGRWSGASTLGLSFVFLDPEKLRDIAVDSASDSWTFATVELRAGLQISPRWTTDFFVRTLIDLDDGRPRIGYSPQFSTAGEFTRSVALAAHYARGDNRLSFRITTPLDPLLGPVERWWVVGTTVSVARLF